MNKTDLQRWQTQCINYAMWTFGVPPKHDWIRRPELRGTQPLYRFVLPLSLCPPGNSQLRAGMASSKWRLKKAKQAVADAMFFQHRPRRSPLPGRPQVNAVRFSCHPVDTTSDWAKWPIDVLCERTIRLHNRLNIIHDDGPQHAEVNTWWEPASSRHGFVLIEVRSGLD